MAVMTPPISGPLASEPIAYPFLDIIERFPRDYLWMYPAMLLMLVYIVFSVVLYHSANEVKKLYAHVGMIFSIIAGSILLTDYFVQLAIIQPSLLKGEIEGMAILTQYNPHGLFVVLEEVGYGFMTLSFALFAPLFSRSTRSDKVLRMLLKLAVVLGVLSFAVITAIYGIQREYLFEVAIITIDFLALIPFALITALHFRKGTLTD
jgi:hypothetical protein